MRLRLLRQLWLMLGLPAVIGVLALACEEEETVVPTLTATAITAITPAPAVVAPGAAGIPSRPRPVRGLEGVLTLDDGLAMWKERPANEDRTGATQDTIKIGMTAALTGPFAGLGYLPAVRQVETVVQRVNEAGGIHGRRLRLIVRDDAYSPPLAVSAVTELVENDQVFVMLAGSGTPTLAATVDYLAQKKVPLVAARSGAALFAEPTKKTAFMGSIFPYLLEGQALGEYILSKQPEAKIAAIYQHDVLGQELLDGLKAALQRAGRGRIVAEISYEVGTPDPTPLMQAAVDSGATYLAILTFAPVAQIVKGLRETAGSDIPVVVSSAAVQIRQLVEAAGSRNYDGVTGIIQYKDERGDDPAVAKYKALLEAEGIGAAHPWVVTANELEVLLRALELAGPDLTREGLIEALETGFVGSWACSLCLGAPIYGPQDHWATETFQRASWSHAQQEFLRVGGPVSYETSEGKGIRGNIPGFECQPATCPWKEEKAKTR